MSQSERAASYAALILADDDVEITVSFPRRFIVVVLNFLAPQADKLQTLIKAANVEDVESIWTTLFAKVSPPSIISKIDTKDKSGTGRQECQRHASERWIWRRRRSCTRCCWWSCRRIGGRTYRGEEGREGRGEGRIGRGYGFRTIRLDKGFEGSIFCIREANSAAIGTQLEIIQRLRYGVNPT